MHYFREGEGWVNKGRYGGEENPNLNEKFTFFFWERLILCWNEMASLNLPTEIS